VDLAHLTLAELSRMLASKAASSREITAAFLDRIAKGNDKLHAFVEVYAEEARAFAEAADRQRATGLKLGPLHGLPIAFKDLCDIEGRIGTGGSKMWEKRIATTTSATVERLLAAGMVPLGKLHMVEFAFGGWGTNPLMGAPWNPWDVATHRVPGGSSSGTGVAVAARLAPAGIGSDTGGSVRIPCAFNGLVGLKVTHGRISLHGTLLLSHTLDTIGPMARCVEDCALLLQALVGADPRDAATLAAPPPENFLRAALKPQKVAGSRIALPDASQFRVQVHADVSRAWQAAAETLRGLGANVVAVRLPDWFYELAAPAAQISASEAFSHHRGWIEDESQPIGPAVRQRVLAAKTYAPAAYAETLFRREERRRAFAHWFEAFDAILLPAVPIPAIPLAEVDEGSSLPALLTRAANYLGLCAMSMPSGFSSGLPVGIQIIGKPFAESTVLRIARAFQDATDFHRQRPKLGELGL
jgi:aspartyl-tRNA(Asn)/glutamyl-tRNA(Gln) amidotransferase subunit A